MDLEIFDQASRGAWGSLKLIWITNALHPAALGALLMVLSLGFDTFSQQVLSFKFRSVASISPNHSASFPRSEILGPQDVVGLDDLTALGVTNNTIGVPAGIPGRADVPQVLNTATLAIRATVLNGILAGDVSDLPVHCSTGNCTWPTIPTLGMCGGCTDVTANLTKACGHKGRENATDTILDYDETYCNYSLPSGTNFTSSRANGVFGTIFHLSDLVSNNTQGDVYKQSIPSDSLGPYVSLENKTPDEVGDVQLYTANFEAIYTPWNSSGLGLSQIASVDTQVFATECALWLCVQAYDVSVSSGRLSQSMVRSWSKAHYRGLQGDNFNVGFSDLPAEFNVAPSSNYSVSLDALTNLFYLFDFSNSIVEEVQNFTCDGEPGCKLPATDLAPVAVLTSSSYGAAAMWASSQDWDGFIQGIARSVTNNIRTYATAPDDTQALYAGQAYITESYVHVRWAWITYPAAMVFASFLYLLIVMWQSHRSSRTYNCYAWKDSTLALLSVSLDQQIMEEAKSGLAGPGELSERIGNKEVVLENDWGTLALRQVDSSILT